MSLLNKLRHLLQEPPPEFVFEFSGTGIAWAHRGKTYKSGFEPLEEGALTVSPVHDNVKKPEALEAAVTRIISQCDLSGGKRRRPCALILPDYCGRVAVLDFDSFPSVPQEQLQLVRFRVKKSVPFDLDAASVSYQVQPHSAAGKKKDVAVAVVSLEILARYEAPLRMAGLHPGQVTISALTALNLLQSTGLDVTAKLSGNVLAVAVTENNALRMFRCVELDHLTAEAILTVLFPTYAYIEDELKKHPERLLLCGFSHFGDEIAPQVEEELKTRVEPVRSPYGLPGPANAGLLGFVHGIGLEVGAAA